MSASAPPPGPSTSSSAPGASGPKKTTILSPPQAGNAPANGILANKKKIIKIFEIVLTLFYGQFIANAIYDNFIRGLPDLIESQTAFHIIKVTLGILMLAISGLALAVIWLKLWRIIFVSAILLIIISITSLIVTIIDLVTRKERGQTVGKDFAALIAQVTFETLFRIGAIVIKFFMVKLLRMDYHRVPTSA